MCPGNPRCSPAEQADISKRMVFADLKVFRDGQFVERASPAKFIYHRQPDMPTTEISLVKSLREDLYLVVGTVDPTSKRATFQMHVNPLVSFIWIGVGILILGASISLWPELSFKEIGAWGYLRAGAGVATSVMLAVWLTTSPTSAYAASSRTKLSVTSEPMSRDLPLGGIGALAAGLAFGTALAVVRRRRAR